MSASICSSSRRMPVRLTRSSTEENRGPREADGRTVQSCAQLLQKNDPALTTSSIDPSSQPHFGQEKGPGVFPDAFSIAFPTSSRNPDTYRKPNRIPPSVSTVQSQSEYCTSTLANRTPRRCASFTSVAGA